MMRVCSPTCPHSNVLAHANAAQGPKRLISKRIQVILASKGMPLGECRSKGFLDADTARMLIDCMQSVAKIRATEELAERLAILEAKAVNQ